MGHFSNPIPRKKQCHRRCFLVPFVSRISWMVVVVSLALIISVVSKTNDEELLLPWQQCSVFVAPTIAMGDGNSMNWGVYANRDFAEGEIVDISPLTVPIPDGSRSVEQSVLNDYVYGYWRIFDHPHYKGKHSIEKLYSVLFGPDMFYNHHPVAPNVQFSTFGREPEAGIPDAVNPQGFVANRKIRRGEELFSSYNGKEDGGAEWFGRRGISMETPSFADSPLVNNPYGILDKHANEFCSKIYSGVGLPSWRDRLLPLLPKHYDLPFFIDSKWLAPSFDAGWGDARTKVDVKRGERLEVSTALVLSREFSKDSALMPLVYAWKDLHDDHREELRELVRMGRLHLQYQGPDTAWKPINSFSENHANSFEDLVLFPVAGNIGMVRRQNAGAKPNCRLIVHSPTKRDDSSMSLLEQPVGVTIELVATEDMTAGTILIVDLAESVASTYEYKLLFRELKLTGQPFAKEVFQDLRYRQSQSDGVTTTRSNGEEL